MAVLVDSTNFSGALWTNYNPNPSIDLGGTEGWHEAWIGLRGRLATFSRTWQWTRLKLDQTPPTLTITGPTNGVTSQPMIQLTGSCPEPLASLTYGVSNATGVVTGQMGLITRQDYDTNQMAFGPCLWQCFDVPLAVGDNVITLYAQDWAGNATVVSRTFTLDGSGDTTPPAITLQWPLDGTQVAAGSDTLTWRGQLDDPTATVTAQVVDVNGVTNTLTGIVERTGGWWVEGLPLSPGTNFLTLVATDVWTNSSTTNITVVKSDVGLIIYPVTGDLLYQEKATVYGTVSDATRAVWVNGVQAVADESGYWTATNVPVSDGGVVSFYVATYPGDQQPDPGAGGNGVNPPGNMIKCVFDGERDARIRTTWTQDHYEWDLNSTLIEANGWNWQQNVGGTGAWTNFDFGLVCDAWPPDREPFTQGGTGFYPGWGIYFQCGGPPVAHEHADVKQRWYPAQGETNVDYYFRKADGGRGAGDGGQECWREPVRHQRERPGNRESPLPARALPGGPRPRRPLGHADCVQLRHRRQPRQAGVGWKPVCGAPEQNHGSMQPSRWTGRTSMDIMLEWRNANSDPRQRHPTGTRSTNAQFCVGQDVPFALTPSAELA